MFVVIRWPKAGIRILACAGQSGEDCLTLAVDEGPEFENQSFAEFSEYAHA